MTQPKYVRRDCAECSAVYVLHPDVADRYHRCPRCEPCPPLRLAVAVAGCLVEVSIPSPSDLALFRAAVSDLPTMLTIGADAMLAGPDVPAEWVGA